MLTFNTIKTCMNNTQDPMTLTFSSLVVPKNGFVGNLRSNTRFFVKFPHNNVSNFELLDIQGYNPIRFVIVLFTMFGIVKSDRKW